jgi:hypothetical protein
MTDKNNLANLKKDCEHYNNNYVHFDDDIFESIKVYIDSEAFTIKVFNDLTDIEKLYSLEYMMNSEKFILFAFKTDRTHNILSKIMLRFISKINKTILRQYVNSEDFTIDIFKVLYSDVKIYIILLFNSTRATEYLFKNADDISNFAQIYADFQIRDDEYEVCPKNKIYIYYPFLIIRALKADKRFFNSINKSSSSTRQMSFLQTVEKIYYITCIIKSMINIHKKPIEYVPGLNPFISLIKQFKTKGKKDKFNLSVLTEDNFNTIGESLYKEYNSLLKAPSLFDKLKVLLEVINNYKERNKVFLEHVDKKLMVAYKKEHLYNIPEEHEARGNLLDDMTEFNRYYDFFARRTFEEYKIINEVYTNNDAIMISPNSKSSKTNPHYQKLLLEAKLNKPILDPVHIIYVGKKKGLKSLLSSSSSKSSKGSKDSKGSKGSQGSQG